MKPSRDALAALQWPVAASYNPSPSRRNPPMRVARLLAALAAVVLSFHAFAQDVSRLDTIQRQGKLRVCPPGDYKPFSLARPDGGFEGLDVDLVQSVAKALGVQAEFVKVTWPTLMKDFVEKCDVASAGSRSRWTARRPPSSPRPTWSTARRRSPAA